MQKRGYIINLAPNAVNKPAAEKPPAKPPKQPATSAASANALT
jgi:hypothetical protein